MRQGLGEPQVGFRSAQRSDPASIRFGFLESVDMKKTWVCLGAALLVVTWASSVEPPFTLALQAYTFKDRSMVETIETAKRLGFCAIELTPVQKLGGTFAGSVKYSESLFPMARASASLRACWMF